MPCKASAFYVVWKRWIFLHKKMDEVFVVSEPTRRPQTAATLTAVNKCRRCDCRDPHVSKPKRHHRRMAPLALRNKQMLVSSHRKCPPFTVVSIFLVTPEHSRTLPGARRTFTARAWRPDSEIKSQERPQHTMCNIITVWWIDHCHNYLEVIDLTITDMDSRPGRCI
jgi:hypothetical protein